MELWELDKFMVGFIKNWTFNKLINHDKHKIMVSKWPQIITEVLDGPAMGKTMSRPAGQLDEVKFQVLPFFFKYGRQKVQLSKMVVEDVEVYLSIKHSCLTINNDGLANSFGDLQRWKWHMVRMNWAWVNIGET